jgi:hypothetical protein
LQAQAALNASGSADKTALGAEIANAYEGFGKPIDLATLASQLGMTQSDIGSYIGSAAQQIAKENTDAGLSTVARLDAANSLANHNITADLNKRGILNSGETGYELDHQNLSYRQASSDAYQKFLGYLQNYQSGYLAAQEKRAEALAQAYSDAADRQFGLWGNSGGGGGGGGGGAPAPTPTAETPAPTSSYVGGSLPGKVGGGVTPINPFLLRNLGLGR